MCVTFSVLMLQGHRNPPLLGFINADDISLPIGSMPNPLADRNIDAAQYGWDNTDGWNTIPGTGDSGHSDHVAEPYPDTYRWWRHLFAGDGNSSWAAAAIGVQ